MALKRKKTPDFLQQEKSIPFHKYSLYLKYLQLNDEKIQTELINFEKYIIQTEYIDTNIYLKYILLDNLIHNQNQTKLGFIVNLILKIKPEIFSIISSYEGLIHYVNKEIYIENIIQSLFSRNDLIKYIYIA